MTQSNWDTLYHFLEHTDKLSVKDAVMLIDLMNDIKNGVVDAREMKIYRMNEFDAVLHHSFDEAAKYYHQVTGVFEKSKDEYTGAEYEIWDYWIYVNEPGDEPQRMIAKKALEENLITLPAIFTSEN